ncbi:MAG TPA: hypothetical protein VNK23_03705 [Candidatus Dormibacteraeota bacterium]|nr:hypothetical protein [Candidatus Dormibacteraeota bacterium]
MSTLRVNEDTMRGAWFTPLGWIYRPVSWQGWTAVLFTLAFCLQMFRVIDRHSHSASDTLHGVFPYFVCAAGMLNWVASETAHSASV